VRLVALQCAHLLGAERVIAIDRLLERPDKACVFRTKVTEVSEAT
jgi:threonine dehydrogenase-like Zn-dependent dehydrogenase